MLYRATWLVPISTDPIPDGAVLVQGGRIVAVGRAESLIEEHRSEPVRDLGDAALLPGLVNTHSHLELTAFRGFLEDDDFRTWITRLTDIKVNRLSTDDLLDSARLGALESIRGGVTCSGDTCDSGVALDALVEAGMRGVVFQEVFGPAPAQLDASFSGLVEKVERLRKRATARVTVGVSPHAPYTVSGPLFRRVAEYAISTRSPIAIHAAESMSEDRFVRAGEGPFAERLRLRGIDAKAHGTSVVAYLDSLDVLAAKPLLIHAVHADDRDLDAIAQSGSRVAHCPKSNAKLGHGVARLGDMLDRGISVGLGTDSVASNNVVDLIDEARAASFFARACARDARRLSARSALELATIGGARALGLEDRIGTLGLGKQADLCAVSLEGTRASPVYDVETALVFSTTARDVILTIVDGNVVFDSFRHPSTSSDESRLSTRLREIAAKIRAS